MLLTRLFHGDIMTSFDSWVRQPAASRCSTIMRRTPFLRENFQLHLDFVDAAIFLYIIGNDDRKSYIGKGEYKNLMIAMDNGKGSVTLTTRRQMDKG